MSEDLPSPERALAVVQEKVADGRSVYLKSHHLSDWLGLSAARAGTLLKQMEDEGYLDRWREASPATWRLKDDHRG